MGEGCRTSLIYALPIQFETADLCIIRKLPFCFVTFERLPSILVLREAQDEDFRFSLMGLIFSSRHRNAILEINGPF